MGQSTYARIMDSIRKTDALKADRIEQLLTNWRRGTPRGIRIVDNLQADVRIPDRVMEQILDKLYEKRSLPVQKIEVKIYKPLCHRFTLHGPEIDKTLISEKVGAAKTIEHFRNALVDDLDYMDEPEAMTLIAKLCGSDPLSPEEEELQVAAFSSWITWSETDGENPFDFVTDPQELIRLLANLGLSHEQVGSHHLLFIYPKEAITEIRFPTVADAVTYSYFKTTDCEDYCSRTQPWNPEDYVRRGVPEEDVWPRPEAVHKPVLLKHLKKPVRVIKCAK